MPLPTSHLFIVPSSPTSGHRTLKLVGLIQWKHATGTESGGTGGELSVDSSDEDGAVDHGKQRLSTVGDARCTVLLGLHLSPTLTMRELRLG
jgi:hypothetical protein